MKLRLFVSVATMEARKQMSYRFDFWASAVLGFALPVALIWFLWRAIFESAGTDVVGGYTFGGMVTYYTVVQLLGKVVRGFDFNPGASEEIYAGSLSRYLLYPAPYFGFKYAQQLGQAATGIVQLVLFGAIAHAAFGLLDGMQATPASLAMAAVAVVFANMLHFLLYWPVDSVAFWQDNVWSLNVMVRFTLALLGGAMLPLSVFPAWAAEAILWTPFPYIFWFPARVLTGEADAGEWLRGLAACSAWIAILGAVSLAVWRRGSRNFGATGI